MQVFPNTLTHQDVNNFTETGIYCYNDGGLGVPPNAPSGMEIFVLEVLNTGESGFGANMIIQKAYNYDMKIAIRIKFINTWRDWIFL
jgi:hypothetical protein